MLVQHEFGNSRRSRRRNPATAHRAVDSALPHGAPIELYQPACSSATRRELGLPAQGPLLSTFGLLSRGKGLEQTIGALPALVAKWPDLCCVIAGRHPGVLRYGGRALSRRPLGPACLQAVVMLGTTQFALGLLIQGQDADVGAPRHQRIREHGTESGGADQMNEW